MPVNSKLKEVLSICIFGNECVPEFVDCVRLAAKLAAKVFFVDSGSRDVRSRAAELGAHPVDPDSLQSTVQSEWVLFLKTNERFNFSSPEKLYSLLSDKTCAGYWIRIKDDTTSLLKNYQLIGNLGQYDWVVDSACVTRDEVRLVRTDFANECLNVLLGHQRKIPFNGSKTAASLLIEPISTEKESQEQEDQKEHDRRCLSNEIYYGPAPGEDLDELSSAYIGFRILHKGYLDGFMENAERGFGIDAMYLPMLEFLNRKGDYRESKDLLEAWVRNRNGEETKRIHTAGGIINANLFLLDEAISCYEKAIELSMDPDIFATIGKLYLIKGEREKAASFIEKSIEMQPDTFHQLILSIIKGDEWRPLTVGLCMIAKDEENTIEKTLASVKNIVDEIVVVDTGSSDRTMEIVREYGGRVIESQWNDDFSAARNSALEEAQSDYVFTLDADEFIHVRDRLNVALFKKLLPRSCNVAYRLKIALEETTQNMSASYLNRLLKQEPIEYRVRLFPRLREVFFSGAAFESVEPSLRHIHMEIATVQLFNITHGNVNKEFRNARKIKAVKKSFHVIESPADILEGGLFFLRLGDLEEACSWFERLEQANPGLVAKVAMLYTKQNLYNCSERIIRKALKDSPDSLALHLALAEICLKEERYGEVHGAVAKLIDHSFDIVDSEAVSEIFYYSGFSLLETGQIAKGIDHIAQALERNPLDTKYHMAGLYAFARADQWKAFFEVSRQIIEQEEIEIDFEIQDFSDVGRLVLILLRHFAGSGRKDEAMICEKVLSYLIRAERVKEGDIDTSMKNMNDTNRATLIEGADT